MQTFGKYNVAKSSNQKFICKVCHYFTCRKSNYEKHILTDKHILRESEVMCPHKCSCGKLFTRIGNLNRNKKTCMYQENGRAKVEKVANSLPKVCHIHECVCGRTYKHACSLSKHKRTCLHVSRESTIQSQLGNSSEVLDVLGTLNAKLDKTCIDNQVLKEDNKLLKEKLSQLESGVMTAVSEPKTVNNYNNIVFLLNEKCSDAIAITDFAKQIVMQIEDVDYAMENGKVRGIENIIRRKFEELGTFKRPMHCTDVKRGTLYVKNEEGWEKEKGEINKMIRDVECAQSKGIKVWSEANPEYSQGNTRLMDKWLRIVNCLTGSIEGIGMRKIEKRCHEICKIDQNVIV